MLRVLVIAFSLNDLAAYRQIQLSRGGQIRSNQIQICHLRGPVVSLRVQIIHQRRLAVLKAKANCSRTSAASAGTWSLYGFSRVQRAHQREVGRIDVVEHLRLRGFLAAARAWRMSIWVRAFSPWLRSKIRSGMLTLTPM